MPRNERVDVGGEVYHVINRGNGRQTIFQNEEDYLLFESLLEHAKEFIVDMRIIAYTIMPNHWHLVLYPKKDGDLSLFMHWLTTSHTRKHHVMKENIGGGHLYQGRYKSFLVDTDSYFLSVFKYVERNPMRAKLTENCEDWRWGSSWRRSNGSEKEKKLLSSPLVDFPEKYSVWINKPEKEDDVVKIRNSINKGVPYGRDIWSMDMVEKYELSSSLNKPGRPKKKH
ncbi:MAG: transposase [Candidatus Paceibacterota bacterium]|jgi:putative transposase|nr:transposase [Candidatus Paceibacterota bacterium]